MGKPIVFLFSGQGSQYYHMGKELWKSHPTFRYWMLKLDALVAPYTGISVVNEIYHPQKGVQDSFDRLLYTHSAIFMVEYALYQVLLEQRIKPDYVLGTSLGEFTSAAVAGVLSVEDIAACVASQASAIERSCAKGGMIAILNRPDLYYETPQLYENCELASINYSSHFVISGEEEQLGRIIQFLKEEQILHQRLAVSYAFHSSLLEAAEEDFLCLTQAKSYRQPVIPIISSLQGGLAQEVNDRFFWEIVSRPIRFQEAIRYLENLHECIYVDVGPSGTLANFIKQQDKEKFGQRCFSICTPFNQEFKNLHTLQSLFCP
ncbi:hypothetical protein D3C73_370300 [compost metagenome]